MACLSFNFAIHSQPPSPPAFNVNKSRSIACAIFSRGLHAMQRILSASSNRGRFYFYQGQSTYYPSVTTVLSVIHKPQVVQWARDIERRAVRSTLVSAIQNNCLPASVGEIEKLLEDAQKQADSDSNEGASIGKKAHALIEDLLASEDPLEFTTQDPELELIEKNWKNWYRLAKERYNIQFINIEEPIISTSAGFGGTIDAVARVNIKGEEKVVVLDWKTSNAFHSEYAMQISAYAKAYEEMFRVPVHSAIIVRLDKKEPKYESKKVKNVDKAYAHFLSILDVWKMRSHDFFSE